MAHLRFVSRGVRAEKISAVRRAWRFFAHSVLSSAAVRSTDYGLEEMPLRVSAICAIACSLGAIVLMNASAADVSPPVSPLANSKAAAEKGKAIYLRLCQYCHGHDGKALENIDFQASNLTDPSVWKHGTDPGSIFNSIKNGAGEDMLPFKSKASDEEIWQLVAFILNIGPEERRPKND